jgi:hypothetical protein
MAARLLVALACAAGAAVAQLPPFPAQDVFEQALRFAAAAPTPAPLPDDRAAYLSQIAVRCCRPLACTLGMSRVACRHEAVVCMCGYVGVRACNDDRAQCCSSGSSRTRTQRRRATARCDRMLSPSVDARAMCSQ